jgi:ribosomal protein L7Ae-like RNA K-turn-binding protein
MPNSLNVLGLARKAGHVEAGEEAAGAACKTGKARLLIVALDASDNARHRADHFTAAGHALRLDVRYTKAELGRALGMGTPSMVALTDAGLAALFVQKLSAEFPGIYDLQAAILEKKAARIHARKKETVAHQRNVKRGKRRIKR